MTDLKYDNKELDRYEQAFDSMKSNEYGHIQEIPD